MTRFPYASSLNVTALLLLQTPIPDSEHYLPTPTMAVSSSSDLDSILCWPFSLISQSNALTPFSRSSRSVLPSSTALRNSASIAESRPCCSSTHPWQQSVQYELSAKRSAPMNSWAAQRRTWSTFFSGSASFDLEYAEANRASRLLLVNAARAPSFEIAGVMVLCVCCFRWHVQDIEKMIR